MYAPMTTSGYLPRSVYESCRAPVSRRRSMIPAASRPRRFAKMLLFDRPSSIDSSSIERGPSAR